MQQAGALTREMQVQQIPPQIEDLRIDLTRPLSSRTTLASLFQLLRDASPKILVFNIRLSPHAWAPRIPIMPQLVSLQTTLSHARLARFLRDPSAAPHLADLRIGACSQTGICPFHSLPVMGDRTRCYFIAGPPVCVAYLLSKLPFQTASLCFPCGGAPGVLGSPLLPLQLLYLQLKFDLHRIPRVLSSVQQLLLLNNVDSLQMIDVSPSVRVQALSTAYLR